MRQRLALATAMILAATGTEALTWSDRAPVSPARGNHAAGVIDNVLYTAGGGYFGGFSWASHDDAAAYIPDSDVWWPMASLSVLRAWPAGAVAEIEVAPGVFEPRLFVIGGIDVWTDPVFPTAYSSIEVYEPATDSWSNFSQSLPGFVTTAAGAAVVDNQIYMLGGHDDGFTLSDQMLVIDPVTETITPLASTLPAPASTAAVAVVGRTIYQCGGWETTYGRPTARTRRYDVDAGTWDQGAPMRQATAGATAVALGTTIYVIGGWNGVDITYADVLAYDTVNDVWTDQTPINCNPVAPFAGRNGASAHVLRSAGDDWIHVVGGVPANVTEVSCHEYSGVSLIPDVDPPDFAGQRDAVESSCTADDRYEVDLGWGAATDATPPILYNVHRSTDPTFVPSAANRIASDLTTTAYTDVLALADCGQSYTYVVRSLDSAIPPNEDLNAVRLSVDVTCLDPPVPPDVGNLLYVTHPTGEPLLDWTTYPSPALANHYHVRRTATKSTIPGSIQAEPTALTWTDTSASDLEHYEILAATGCGHTESAD